MNNVRSFADLLLYIEKNYDSPAALNDYSDGAWKPMSHKQFVEEVKALALWLKSVGIGPGDNVGLLAQPSSRWTVADIALGLSRGVSVPLFGNISNENFVYECTQAGIKTLLVSGEEQWKMYRRHSDLFERVVALDTPPFSDKVIPYETAIHEGKELLAKDPEALQKMLKEVVSEETVTIIYTSGSTGLPKGAELSHWNLLCLNEHEPVELYAATDRYLNIIPTAHVLGRSLNTLMLRSGIPIYYFNDIKNVGIACREIHPTIITLVPRLLEKIYAKMVSNVDAAGFLKRTIGHWAFSLANEEEGGIYKTLMHGLADKVVYTHLREALGGAFRLIISGGAALNPHLCHFFIDIGLPVFEGYGLTESAVVSVNTPSARKIGSVGKPIHYIQAKLSPEGELLLKGDSVFKGYYKNPKATRETFTEEGWLKTGDKATIDEEGYITLIGRLKELYKSSTGEYIAPVPLEQELGKAPFIDMSIIVADKRKYVSCLIFPDTEVLRNLKRTLGQEALSDEEFVATDYIKREMETLISTINQHFNEWEQIRAYRFVHEPLTIEGGELTPSMKISRHVVLEKYKSLIDSMYPEEAHL